MGTKVIFVLNDLDVAEIFLTNVVLFLQIRPLPTLVLSAKKQNKKQKQTKQ